MSAEESVLAAAASIVDDFGHHRTAEYFAAFDPEATFVFYTTQQRLESRAEYEALWAKWEREQGFVVHSCRSENQRVRLVNPDAAIFMHDVISTVELEGQRSTVEEQETIVFANRAGRWRAVHEHLSPAASTTAG